MEERQQKWPPIVQPCQSNLHNETRRLRDVNGSIMNLAKFPSVFRPLRDAFIDPTVSQYKDIWSLAWKFLHFIWISKSNSNTRRIIGYTFTSTTMGSYHETITRKSKYFSRTNDIACSSIIYNSKKLSID